MGPGRTGRRPAGPDCLRVRPCECPRLAEKKPSEQSPTALSPGHITLIEATWRAVHLLATLATKQMRYEDIDDLVGEAHNAMRQIMTDDSD